MIRLVPARAAVAALYVAIMLAATLSSGARIDALGIPPGLLDAGHVPLFAGLCLVTLWAVEAPLAGRMLGVAVFCVLFAAADEWAQRFVLGRVPQLADFAADLAGVGLGLAIGFLFVRGGASAFPSRGDSTR